MRQVLMALMATFLLMGCGNDILDTNPTDRYTQETFWSTPENASAALIGCYSVLRNNGIYGGSATPLLEETATPNAYNYDNTDGWNVIAAGTQTATNSAITSSRWNDCYRGIGRCNTLISGIDKVSMPETQKKRMKAEALFLRALYYSLLEMYYGGVPLILTDPNPATQANLPRNTRAEIVQQVLKDLEEAAAVLPVTYAIKNDVGRATKGAALALKARVLLFEASPLVNTASDGAKWKQAADAAKAVIDLPGTGYDLFPNYRTLFLPANENSQECVFDVQFKAPEQSTIFDAVGQQTNTNAPLRSLVDAYLMKDGLPTDQSPLYNPAKPYLNRDPRLYQTTVFPGDTFRGAVVTPTRFAITGYGLKKYTVYDKEPNSLNITQSETNYMVIRFADVLLMYAEAQNEALATPDESIYMAINRIRRRAGMPDLKGTKTKVEMREIIRRERRIELAGEGFYYTDIRRWKTAEQVLKGAIFTHDAKPIMTRTFNPTRDYWWPIPDTQRTLNPNLVQNDGY
ncbi:RagB/SusD family nutrient uptake outer membrane protein [Larkinella bovis]|uniref:RagB/SusD family nutrient uptake outer membrane protein n=1 Tax=Larkinella bovis TaxID=683041 RepID=A0ABW0IK34_9BACT